MNLNEIILNHNKYEHNEYNKNYIKRNSNNPEILSNIAYDTLNELDVFIDKHIYEQNFDEFVNNYINYLLHVIDNICLMKNTPIL